MIEQKRTLVQKRVQKALRRRSTRNRLIRYSLIAANTAVLAVVITFVATTSHNNRPLASAVAAEEDAVGPVDGLTSYDIAANVARMAKLPERVAINNQAQSAQVALAVSTSDTNMSAKPQIVATALKSKDDIRTYTVQAGDTVSSIAQKFGVTTTSVQWSNDLTGTVVALGTKLVIPPINGIVYTVKAGDTVQSLAAKFNVGADQIVAYNDAEIAGIRAGEQILIPNGQIQQRSIAFNFTPIYGSNGYDPGWCTYYAAAMAHVPSNWGNASTWAYYAALSGWKVSKTPVPGAVVQTTSGNHVGYVQEVSEDGSQIIFSDMNGLAGFNHVGTSGWMSASSFYGHGDVEYIYR